MFRWKLRGNILVKILFFDTETDKQNKNVVEIGWILADSDFDYVPLCSGQFLLRGEPHPITNIPAILTTRLQDVTINKYAEVFFQCIDDCDILVAHNIGFDISKISKIAAVPDKPKFCTCYGIDWTKMNLEKRGMDFLCAHFGIDRSGSHSALNDVRHLIEVVKHVDRQYFLDMCEQIVQFKQKENTPVENKPVQEEQVLGTWIFLVQDASKIPEKYVSKNEKGETIVKFENITKDTLYKLQTAIPALRFPNARLI